MKGPRAPIWTSTTAPTPLSPPATPWPAGPHRQPAIGPGQLHRVLGIVKAYTTRVGGGPFPTECLDKIGDHLVECGVEFGSTTGRRRRCGWLDTVVIKDSARLNGLTGLAITKLDVLTTLNPVRICVAYDVDGGAPGHHPPHHQGPGALQAGI